MLKRVAVSDLQIGMFVHKMEGNWFSHPFWKARFLIEDHERLVALRSSALDGVVIDVSKGADVAAPRKPAQRETHSDDQGTGEGDARIRKIAERVASQCDPVTADVEVPAAQAIAARAGKVLQNTFVAMRLGKAINVRAVQPVVADILDSVRRNPQAFSGLMRCKLRNELIYQHALAVSALMVALARQMKLPHAEVMDAGLAGLLLDIGTSYLPQHLETVGGDYRTLEPHVWQQHVVLGYRALYNDGTLSDAVVRACLEHHERIDGGGFPSGLTGAELSTMGRMAAISDTFDFMLTRSGTTEALDPARAVQRMKQMEGAFDPEILRAFIEAVGLFPVGSFVELRSGKIAMVIDEDPHHPDKPVVQAFFSTITGERIKPQRIELAHAGERETIMGIADLTGYNLPEPDHLRDLVFLSSYKLAT
ncbi:HD-GYP domain-containing protein [Porphyrobacter sp. LM 6]|uniref:HD-GYP domain-containing protein n=1 Tax=Porphyrobacter sp. LM 6 TaxID=1896196 RepID=UPI00084757EB|nr:DUF3391 domain-containing protein [Porphyrobacter sp. LM 6]AOL95254.1 HD-GYP domain, c-di-GMP phosphodiesterase class II (or its inactivated variant) [Porphyrobacter sp. LM 6]